MGTRARTWTVVGALTAIAAAVVAVQLTGRQPPGIAPEADPTSSTSPSPTAPPTPEPEPVPVPVPAPTADVGLLVVDGDASALVAAVVAADALARSTPEEPVELAAIATGAALEDLQIGVHELAESGLSQIGTPVVISATITEIDPGTDPPTATTLVCLDYAEVDVVDASGTSVVDPAADPRVATILILVQIDGRWVVERRSFPDDPHC